MKYRFLFPFVAIAAISCGDGGEEPVPEELASMPGFQQRHAALEAACTINVEGYGTVDIESDYIPNVVACENGSSTVPLEALKAQAVQARGFIYYKIFVEGKTTVSNSQGDQVYRCESRLPDGAKPIHIEATEATKGQYLEWKGSIVAPFYVAGFIPPNPDINDPITSCKGDGGSGGANTERFVTYNWGLANCDSNMTTLGWTPEDCNRNPHNRGCASQNGESCLGRLGWKYQDMMDYYYGADIELLSTTGTCGGPPPYVLTDYDRFCGAKADGSYCFDAGTLVDCVGEFGGTTEVCAGECSNDACVGGVEPGDESCVGLADGSHCLDNQLRADCAAEEVVVTESCTAGCVEGECAVAPTNNGTGANNGTGVNNGTNNGVGTPMNDDTQAPGGFPAVVGPSTGASEDGCSSTGSQGTSAPFWSLMVLGLFGWVRRRR